MHVGEVEMGRPKKGTPPPEKAADERVAIIHLKGTQEYAKWLEEVNKKSHIPKAALFRLAMAEWAGRNGYPPPPEL